VGLIVYDSKQREKFPILIGVDSEGGVYGQLPGNPNSEYRFAASIDELSQDHVMRLLTHLYGVNFGVEKNQIPEILKREKRKVGRAYNDIAKLLSDCKPALDAAIITGSGTTRSHTH